jgi:hypothetical protein
MGNRYLVTGVQIGMIKGLLRAGRVAEADEELEKLEQQFLGSSNQDVNHDVATIRVMELFK